MESETEAEVARQAKDRLAEYIADWGVGFELRKIEATKKLPGRTVDLVAHLRAPGPNHQNAVLLIEVKSRGEPFFLANAVEQLNELDLHAIADKFDSPRQMTKPIVAAPYISARGRALLKSRGIGYMDLSGNCSFVIGAFHLDRIGHENPKREKRVARSIFAPKAARVARAMLEEPKRTWTVSELAAATGTSIGHVHAVATKLQQNEYVYRDSGNRLVLEKPAELLDQWASVYRVTDVETIPLYTFQRSVPLFTKKLSQAATRLLLPYALTLHAGASLLAPFTRFNEAHFYARKKDVKAWIEELDLRPAESGANAFILVAPDEGVFYRSQAIQEATVASTTQLYLDLYNYPARGREQAEVLRREKMGY